MFVLVIILLFPRSAAIEVGPGVSSYLDGHQSSSPPLRLVLDLVHFLLYPSFPPLFLAAPPAGIQSDSDPK